MNTILTLSVMLIATWVLGYVMGKERIGPVSLRRWDFIVESRKRGIKKFLDWLGGQGIRLCWMGEDFNEPIEVEGSSSIGELIDKWLSERMDEVKEEK